jgi:hypothetical protein
LFGIKVLSFFKIEVPIKMENEKSLLRFFQNLLAGLIVGVPVTKVHSFINKNEKPA